MLRAFLRWWVSEIPVLQAHPLHGPDRARIEQIRAAGSSEAALQVPDALALRCAVSLPLAAERSLRSLLSLEMDRYTPFTSDAVYFSHRVCRRDPARRRVEVELVAVPCHAVQAWLGSLRAAGLNPVALQALGMRLPLPDANEAGGSLQLRLIAICALVLLATALALPLSRKMETQAALEHEIRGARAQATVAQAARRELDRLLAEESALVERRKQRPAALQVLQDLTELLPDGSWLNHLDLTGSRVRLRGESPSASALVTAMEKSPAFAEASFDGSVTRDPLGGRERFSLSATARSGAGEQR